MRGYIVVVFRVVSWLFSLSVVWGDVVDTNESLIIIILEDELGAFKPSSIILWKVLGVADRGNTR